jgi:hypothetical protein
LESLGRTEEAAALFMQSLQDCSNFGAAYHHLADALKRLGREKEVDALREVYKDIDDA